MSNEVTESNMQKKQPDDGLDKLLKDLEKPSAASPSRKRDDILATTGQLQAPRNRHEWHSSTQANMFRVESLTRSVFDKVNENCAAEAAARKAIQEHAKREREKQRTKVLARAKLHQEFIKKTYKCMKEIEFAIVQMEGAQGRLTAERYARFAEIKVNEHRWGLRKNRPPEELFRDQVQRILEKESDLLNMGRQELLAQEAEAKRISGELHRDWDDLAKDIGNRRLAMRHDESTVNTGEEAPLFESEDISVSRSNDIVEHGYALSVKALQLNDHSHVLVKKMKQRASDMTKEVSKCLAAHTEELAAIKKSLAKKIVESEAAIDKAGTQLRHMEQRVEQGDAAMKEMVLTLKALLRDLRSTRDKTIEDLRSKTTALDIDISCRKVTAQMATAPQKKITSSQSAPNLRSPQNASTELRSKPMGAQEGYGNPQEHERVVAKFGNHRGGHSPANVGQHRQGSLPQLSAGGSNPLKAAAAACVQGHPSH